LSTNTLTTATAHTAPPAPPNLRLARFDDYTQIQSLEAAHLPEALSPNQWQRLWLENPLWSWLGKQWPIGWVLEDESGRIVGSLFNVPSSYQFLGCERICANGRAWVVEDRYRGFALWLMDEYFNQQGVDLFINTTVNAVAAEVFGTLAKRIPLGDWQSSAYWVTGYRRFARHALEKIGMPLAGALAIPAGSALWLKDCLLADALPAASSSLDVTCIKEFDDRFDAFWQELVDQNPEKLLGVRDRRTLAWHYETPMRRGHLRILTASRNGLLRGYCMLKRQDTSGGLARMRLVDYQSLDADTNILATLLHAAVRVCTADGCDMLEHLGCGLPKMATFDNFAPYRRTLPNWTFYCRTADPALEAELEKPEAWDPSEYDGDASMA
jgi:hypothetical protein